MKRTIYYCMVLSSLCCLAIVQAEVIYQTDFTQHYFDDGTFKAGKLTGDGWEAPQGKPLVVLGDPEGGRPTQRIQGTAYQCSRLGLGDLAQKTTSKIVTITYNKVWSKPDFSEPFATRVYSGVGDDRKEVGAVVFDLGYGKISKDPSAKGIISLEGENTVEVRHLVPSHQKVEWRIDLGTGMMSLSVDGCDASVVEFKDTTLKTIDSLDIRFGNDVIAQIDDLKITAQQAGDQLGHIREEPIKIGELSAEVENSVFRILRNGKLILRDKAIGCNKGKPIQRQIKEDNTRGLELVWPQDGMVFKKRVIVKAKEVFLEYLLDSQEKQPWSISLMLPETAWGEVKIPSENGPHCGLFVGNGMELQVGEKTKVIGHYWQREPYWRRTSKGSQWNSLQAKEANYYLVQSDESVDNPRHLRSVVRLIIDGPGLSHEADGDFVDRGNTMGNLNQITEKRFTIVACRDRKYCLQGEKINVTLKYIADDDVKRNIPIEYSLFDSWGRQLDYGVFTFDTSKDTQYPLKFSPKDNGCYRLYFRYSWNWIKRDNEALFSVLPSLTNPELLKAQSIFGSHSYGPNQFLTTLWKNMGMKWNRWWDTGDGAFWKGIEPVKGKYTFEKAEAMWENDQKNGAATLAVLSLHQFPTWVLEEMGVIDECTTKLQRDDPQKFAEIFAERYVRKIAEHFKGRIKYWEIGNEPFFQYNGLENDYVMLLKESYRVLKEVDPQNQVVGVCGFMAAGYENFVRNTIKAGALDYLDIFSVHFYFVMNNTGSGFGYMPGMELLLQDQIKSVRTLMKEYGQEKPIWDTESIIIPCGNMYSVDSHKQNFFNIPYYPMISVDTPISAAEATVKSLVIHQIEDVKYFYFVFYPTAHATSFCEYDGTPLAMGVAWTNYANEMAGARYLEKIPVKNDAVQLYLFEQNKKPIVVTWATKFESQDSTILWLETKNEKLIIKDILGNVRPKISNNSLGIKITTSPVYVIGQNINSKCMKELLLKAMLNTF